MYEAPYREIRVELKGAQPKKVDLPIIADYVRVVETDADTSKVYIALNEPQVFLRLSRYPVIESRRPFIKRLYLRWDSSEEGKYVIFYVAGEPSAKTVISDVRITDDVSGIKSDLDNILSRFDVDLSTRASEDTLTQINTKLSQPTSLKSEEIVIDNSGGSEDLVQALFSESTPSRYATILSDEDNTDTFYVGDSTKQVFPMKAGDKVETAVSDLSAIYVRVPAGAKVKIYVLWEV